MAKRKRLDVRTDTIPADLETKSLPVSRARMPIADVASDTAGLAALEEIAREMTRAEGEGRVVKKIPLSSIKTQHLARDRIVLDAEEMAALKASIAARGQQTPVEVVSLPDEQYGLISGLRRVLALQELGMDHTLALVRAPQGAQEAYQAMVEENEIRANLSFYERAHVAVISVEQGVYRDARRAVAALFDHAPSAKRSKILKFVTICERLGKALHFPAALPEKFGLLLAQALENDARLASRIADALRKTPPADAQAERRMLERALKKQPNAKPAAEALAPGLSFEGKEGRAVLSGPALDADFLEALRAFAVSHAKQKG